MDLLTKEEEAWRLDDLIDFIIQPKITDTAVRLVSLMCLLSIVCHFCNKSGCKYTRNLSFNLINEPLLLFVSIW